jgi:hypothetical protein
VATSEGADGTYDVEGDCWTAIDVPAGGGYKPVALEFMFVSGLMPLEANGRGRYFPETDTLVIGEGQGTATLVEENDDLTAYWCPDDVPGRGPDDLNLIAVALRNASKHLALVIAGAPKTQ